MLKNLYRGCNKLPSRKIFLSKLHTAVDFCDQDIKEFEIDPFKTHIILGIETSCDDTSAAVVNSRGSILGEFTASQYHLHEPNGGIVPNIALLSHTRQLPNVVRTALQKAKVSLADIDAIAFTRGPGMAASLSVGTNAAKTLAAVLRKPLIGVHHMEAHALTVRMETEDQVQFPYLALLISGGHTLIIMVHDVNHHTQIASTLDESIGDAYDKVARALKIPWNPAPLESKNVRLDSSPGGGPGPALEQLALKGNGNMHPLTVPLNDMHRRSQLAFSFSGLRAQVERNVKALEPSVLEDPQFRADMAASFQFTVLTHLESKLKLAFNFCKKQGYAPTTLVAAGGVASNNAIKQMLSSLASDNGIPLKCPPPRLCTDNGAMIAWAGWERLSKGLIDSTQVDFKRIWPLEELGR